MQQEYWHQPEIDPVLLHIWGPLQIRWYSLLYVGGFLVGKFILSKLAKEKRFLITKDQVEQLIVWLLVGTVIGARIIYCFVYDPQTLMANPFFLFEVYKGGLSFHGALIGIILAAYFFAKKYKIPFWNLTDAMALATPTGLAMGRIGNFINGELYGRVSYAPWAVIFKEGGTEPRHPSQLYEFFLEGIVLFYFLWWVKKKTKKDGVISICFLLGYSVCRFTVEFFREPDAQVGYLFHYFTMGQLLSVFMFLVSAAVGYVVLKPFTSNTK
jgi:phosphatidylglycerol:prolipoprotein diacylglycerol transferase